MIMSDVPCPSLTLLSDVLGPSLTLRVGGECAFYGSDSARVALREQCSRQRLRVDRIEMTSEESETTLG